MVNYDPRDIPEQLAPLIRSAAGEMERLRDVPESLMSELAEAGAFSLFTPRELGGYEVPLATAVDVYERFGRLDVSVGWVVWNGNWGFVGALLGEPGTNQIWKAGHPVFANAAQPATAVSVPGGYRVSGDWKLVTGVRNADWVITVAMVEGLPGPALFAIPRDQVTVHDTWRSSGLRGSGSNRVTVTDVFVPADLVGHDTRVRVDRPLYRGHIPALVFPGSAAVVLGAARGAVEETMDLIGDKRELPRVQSVIAQSEASVTAARLLVLSAAEAMDLAHERDEPVTMVQRADLRAAIAHAGKISRQVLTDMYVLGSSASTAEGSPVERLFRDGLVALQHFSMAESFFEAVGRTRFGLDPGTRLF
ncbi:acyl-CoA dehydrogenase family protein [Actinoplanes solisilvae]|uniref:acyl-CoA dehydrogenase family protein n=1 Tax=Actinoplanes solisilvae TaxID=2486853 RepID=UPI000FDC84CC|nr:acyl-CoA dehydrogenase family protein [Actinoplanes solisilvae]